MSDCRYVVSPVNYPDPDPDGETQGHTGIQETITGDVMISCALIADLRLILRGKPAQPTVRNAIIVRDTIILQPSVDPIKANIDKITDNQVEANETKENAE